MNKKTKKGFTLVELLVVIAILAILATVSVVGYTSFINKANMSVDQQAVEQINNYLQALEVNKEDTPATVDAAIVALSEGNLNVNDYVPLTKNTYFYWVKSLNRVIHVDKDNKVLFPEDITETAGWYSLSGHSVRDNSWTAENGTTAIADGAKLYDFIASYDEGNTDATGVNTVTIPAGTVDMQGAVASFGVVKSELTISGAGKDSTTLAGVRAADETSVAAIEKAPGEGLVNRPYYFGMIGTVKNGTTVTIENITIDAANVSFDGAAINGEPSQFALIAGCVEDGGTLILRNVTIKNSNITGYQKVGALVGQLNGTLECYNVTIENTAVTGFSQTAALIGHATKTSNFTFDSDCSFNVDVNALDLSDYDFKDAAYATSLTAGGNTYTWGAGENDSSVYMLCGGITNDYYWAQHSASVTKEIRDSEKNLYRYMIDGAVVDGKQLWVSDIFSNTGTTAIENGNVK